MPKKLATLAKYTLNDKVSCRWDKPGKVWYVGQILKFKVDKGKNTAYVKFEDGDVRWIIIRRGWMKRVEPADSEAEESGKSSAEDEVPKPKPKPKRQPKTTKKKNKTPQPKGALVLCFINVFLIPFHTCRKGCEEESHACCQGQEVT